MVVPMVAAAFVNTFYPDLVKIGSPVSDIFSAEGTMTLVGAMIVLAGIATRPMDLLRCLKRGGILMVLKLLLNLGTAMLVMQVFGKKGFWGISAVALVSCVTALNPAMYVVVAGEYGDELDQAAYAVISLFALPFVPICMLGLSEGYGIDWMAILATGIPFAIGMLLAELDPSIRDFAAPGTMVLSPFLGYCLGCRVDLRLVVQAGFSGFLLYLIFFAVTFLPLLAADRLFLKQKGYSAAAIACVGGVFISVPALMAERDASYLPYVDVATAQVAFCVAVSILVVPLVIRLLGAVQK